MIRNFADALRQHGGSVSNAAPEGDLHERSLALFVRLFPQLIGQGMPSIFLPLIKMQLRRGLLKGMDKFQRELDKGFKLGFDNYIETMTMRNALVGEWEKFFESHDVLVCPIGFGHAFERRKTGTPIAVNGHTMPYVDYVWPYVACFNASGHPAMNIPLGLGKDGLPVGVQVVGPYWSDPELLHFAKLVSAFSSGFVMPQTLS